MHYPKFCRYKNARVMRAFLFGTQGGALNKVQLALSIISSDRK